jgi:hypothetical protein
MGPEEDDQLGLSSGGSDGEESAREGAEDEIAISSINRPSTAGISFATETASGSPRISVRIRFATYEPQTVVIESSEKPNIRNQKYKTEWHRNAHSIDIAGIVVDLSANRIIDLAEYGTLNGIQLHLRSIRWKETSALITATLVNRIEYSREMNRNEKERLVLFQVRMEIRPESGTLLIARPSRRAVTADGDDDEDLSTALLYRKALEYATGHTCSAEWEPGTGMRTAAMVATSWIPRAIVSSFSSEGHEVFNPLRTSGSIKPLSAEWLSTANDAKLREALLEIPAAYGKWIELQEKKIPSLNTACRIQADRNLDRCRKAMNRMAEGAEKIGKNPDIAESFRLANRAMLMQYRWNRNTVENLEWRPFQMGFILLAISSLADRRHPDRNTMDLLWFPTGGGKTEAYLALVAFLAFYRRLTSGSDPDAGAGVAAVMRYTLRLLTTQQFMRAASMILACDAIRRGVAGGVNKPEKFGRTPISIGLWVGGEATPNNYDQAKLARDGLPNSPSPKQLKICPACKTRLKWEYDDRNRAVHVICPDLKCILHNGGAPLPVFTVDEDVYRACPTLLIGTVDKFAQILRRKEVSGLFAMTQGLPPDLIIQDELHLISGPLGTLSGLYEVAVDRLFTRDGVRPKIIGSTATIRRAKDQVRALFDRETCQFPPSAIDSDDSGFALVDRESPGRIYIGVTTAGRSAKYTLQAVSASILQSAEGGIHDPVSRDYYWTLVSYFNSLRELGGAVVLMQDDVNDTISMLSARRGEVEREPDNIEELTSGRTQDQVREMLDLLENHAGADDALDIVLATNMLSVGVDISRLGLMLVNGQPKGISEYIQATSRVGRGRVPGLIVAVLNNAKARDRSHYESFTTWHSTLYRDVEATSVTPFASRARDRALHAVLVALMRYQAPGMLDSPVLNPDAIRTAEGLIDYVAARAHAIDPEETSVKSELQERLNTWERRQPKTYWNSRQPRTTLLQDAEKAATLRALGNMPGDAWPTMNNMRSVEPSTPFRLANRLREFNDGGDQNAQQ